MRPRAPKSTVLTPAEEAVVVAFRQKTLLPLEDVLGCLRDTIPNLSRSALHRCLQRHGISRLPVETNREGPVLPLPRHILSETHLNELCASAHFARRTTLDCQSLSISVCLDSANRTARARPETGASERRFSQLFIH